jgi:hypothetical protein
MDLIMSRTRPESGVFFSGRHRDNSIPVISDTHAFLNYADGPYSQFRYVSEFTAGLPFVSSHS